MKRLLTIGALLLASCASSPDPSSEQPPTEQTEASPSSEELLNQFEAVMPELSRCYSAYLSSFGGAVEGGEMQPAREGPTVYTDDPWSGPVVFRVRLDDPVTVEMEADGPHDTLRTCWRGALEGAPWSLPDKPLIVQRKVEFEIQPE